MSRLARSSQLIVIFLTPAFPMTCPTLWTILGVGPGPTRQPMFKLVLVKQLADWMVGGMVVAL